MTSDAVTWATVKNTRKLRTTSTRKRLSADASRRRRCCCCCHSRHTQSALPCNRHRHLVDGSRSTGEEVDVRVRYAAIEASAPVGPQPMSIRTSAGFLPINNLARGVCGKHQCIERQPSSVSERNTNTHARTPLLNELSRLWSVAARAWSAPADTVTNRQFVKVATMQERDLYSIL